MGQNGSKEGGPRAGESNAMYNDRVGMTAQWTRERSEQEEKYGKEKSRRRWDERIRADAERKGESTWRSRLATPDGF